MFDGILRMFTHVFLLRSQFMASMLLVISPAKSLNYEEPAPTKNFSQPMLLTDSEKLMTVLRKKTPKALAKLMDISENLAQLNYERNQVWAPPFSLDNAKQALFAFNGEVYNGINAMRLMNNEVDFLQKHLCILSGLYGVLKPLDLIQPYRLEMGTTIKTSRGKNLYEFWKNRITDYLNFELNKLQANVLVNLASAEYFKAVNANKLKAQVITPSFLDYSNGKFKTVQFFAKKARGLMVRFIAQNNINNANDITSFNLEGYVYNPKLSTSNKPVFTRKQ